MKFFIVGDTTNEKSFDEIGTQAVEQALIIRLRFPEEEIAEFDNLNGYHPYLFPDDVTPRIENERSINQPCYRPIPNLRQPPRRTRKLRLQKRV